jgi:hypothetical protein
MCFFFVGEFELPSAGGSEMLTRVNKVRDSGACVCIALNIHKRKINSTFFLLCSLQKHKDEEMKSKKDFTPDEWLNWNTCETFFCSLSLCFAISISPISLEAWLKRKM